MSEKNYSESFVRTRAMVLVALFAALVAVGAFIKIPMPICPITLQTFFVALAGLLLGKKYGPMSVAIYVAIGLIGVPVFTAGGGFSYVVQPSFGFLLSFIVGAFLTGLIAGHEEKPSFIKLLVACLVGLVVIYAIGAVYYWLIYTYYIGSGIGVKILLVNCILMPLPGDLLKMVLASLISQRLIPVIRKMGI